MGYEWDFGVVFREFDLLLLGLANTLKVTVLSLGFGVPLGLSVAMLRLVPSRLVSIPTGLFIDFFRTTPPLVQLFWCFFALPILIGVRIDPFEAAVITLSIQSSAFFAEVFRGGIISIEQGQWEAGRALGMSYAQLMRRVILPQAVKRMVPAFLERIIELFKTTSLVAAVSYADLLFQANEISQKTYRTVEVYTVAACMYLVVSLITSLFVRRLEHRLAASGEVGGH
ncbi:MAG: amino acid ABC transporter permease [Alphaproteobacteria bacterium]